MKTWILRLIGASLIASSLSIVISVQASDHDDGETNIKSRNTSLTDVYVFREDKEILGGSNKHLVFLINTNPRSLPRQQYYFSTTARYKLHVGRAGTNTAAPARTNSDVIFRVEFGEQNTNLQQPIKLTFISDEKATVVKTTENRGQILTTPLTMASTPIVTKVALGSQSAEIFAGLRKDPFFFDVTAFFKFRSAAAGTGGALPVPGFSAFPVYTPNGETPLDFTTNNNVNTIALRVPIALLQRNGETVFDTWATVSIPQL